MSGQPDLSFEKMEGQAVSPAPASYQKAILTFMAQPSDTYELLRQRLRNLPDLPISISQVAQFPQSLLEQQGADWLQTRLALSVELYRSQVSQNEVAPDFLEQFRNTLDTASGMLGNQEAIGLRDHSFNFRPGRTLAFSPELSSSVIPNVATTTAAPM